MFSPDGAFKEPGVLEDHAEQVVDVFPGEVGDIFAVDADLAAVQLIKPHEKIDQSGFSRAGGAYNGNFLPGLCVGGEILNDGFVRRIAEADVREHHVALDLRGGQAFCFMRLVGQLLLIQEFKDPLRSGGGGLEAGSRLGDLRQGLVN